MVEEFTEFSDIGRKLGTLHVNYENAKVFDFGVALDKELYKVPIRKIRYSKSKGKSDYSKLILNEKYVLEGIPLEVQDYKISGRSALDWVIDRYEIKEDSASGIIQDPNKWSSNEPYILNLIGKVVTVSIETVKLINQLPDFE
jgi:predicted helicase